jgi:hypothetical protein
VVIFNFKRIFYKEDSCLANFIGRFENLDSNFNKICETVNIKERLLDVKNKSTYNHYKEYYSQKNINIIRHVYKEDIKLFKYEF